MNYTFAWPWLDNKYGKHFWMEPFFHRRVTDALSAQEQVNDTIRIQGDAFTLWFGFAHFATTTRAATVGVIPQGGDFRITLAVEDRNIDEGAITSVLYGSPVYANVLANSQMAINTEFTFPYPKAIKPGGYIKYDIINGDLDNNIIEMRFDIVKFYPKPGFEREIESMRQAVIRM